MKRKPKITQSSILNSYKSICFDKSRKYAYYDDLKKILDILGRSSFRDITNQIRREFRKKDFELPDVFEYFIKNEKITKP